MTKNACSRSFPWTRGPNRLECVLLLYKIYLIWAMSPLYVSRTSKAFLWLKLFFLYYVGFWGVSRLEPRAFERDAGRVLIYRTSTAFLPVTSPSSLRFEFYMFTLWFPCKIYIVFHNGTRQTYQITFNIPSLRPVLRQSIYNAICGGGAVVIMPYRSGMWGDLQCCVICTCAKGRDTHESILRWLSH